jgi:phosphatidylglycerophosphate synthase
LSLKSTTWRTAAVGAILLALSSGLFAASGSFGAVFILGTFLSYSAAVWIIATRIGVYHPYLTFGIANAITLLRLVIVCQFAGLVLHMISTEAASPIPAWSLCSLAILERLLDGIDGYAARKQGMRSAFGARFDMEVDGLQIFLLSVVVFLLDKAGAWVLIGGLLRYAFLGASALWPVFNASLPPSLRRKCAAVIQGVTLAVLLAPIVLPPISAVAAAIALAVLIYSFAVDSLWLLRSQSKV